jgi:beta-glucosidase
VPGCGNRELETDILKGEWGFDGFIESDDTAGAELRACPPRTADEGPCGHGMAADGPDAAAHAHPVVHGAVTTRLAGVGC